MEIYEIFSCAEFLEMEVDDATMRHIPTFLGEMLHKRFGCDIPNFMKKIIKFSLQLRFVENVLLMHPHGTSSPLL